MTSMRGGIQSECQRRGESIAVAQITTTARLGPGGFPCPRNDPRWPAGVRQRTATMHRDNAPRQCTATMHRDNEPRTDSIFEGRDAPLSLESPVATWEHRPVVETSRGRSNPGESPAGPTGALASPQVAVSIQRRVDAASDRSREDVADDLAVHVRQSVVSSIASIREAFVVETELVQDRRVEIVHVNLVVHRQMPELVGRAVGDPGLHASPGQPDVKPPGLWSRPVPFC